MTLTRLTTVLLVCLLFISSTASLVLASGPVSGTPAAQVKPLPGPIQQAITKTRQLPPPPILEPTDIPTSTLPIEPPPAIEVPVKQDVTLDGVAVIGEEPHLYQPTDQFKSSATQRPDDSGKLPPANPGEELRLDQSDMKPNLASTLEPLAPTAGWNTLMSETFEGTFPSGAWRVFDNDGTTNGQYYWDDDDYRPYTGYWSGWVANGGANALDPQVSLYQNNMRSWMVYGPFDLSNAADAELLFNYWNQSERNYDWFGWYASTNGTNFYGASTSGDSLGWKSVNFDLTNVPGLGNLTGRSAVWIAFVFTSDGSIVDDGAFVDNVLLQKYTTGATCPTISQWKGEYWNNPTLTGGSTACRNDANLSFDWGTGSPAAGIPTDRFSARWTRTLSFAAGRYRFHLRGDDGIRLWLDNTLVIDAWRDQGPTEYTTDRDLTAGNHTLKVEYYENTGGASVALWWETLCPNQYKAEYYNNRSLSGSPTFTRCENWPINYNWGTGGPGNGVSNDNFSVRWTGTANINAGTYSFIAVADDGVRVWLDNALIIDAWRDQGPTEYRVNRTVVSGAHTLKVEYYENSGGATAKFRWEVATGIVISNRAAFDKCEIPTTSQMQTWWNSSPYREMNLYIGGSVRACANNGLNASWVSTVRSQGWNFIPTWVGPQAPCSGFGSKISYDINTAYAQGRNEANAAAAKAQSLGLTTSGQGGTIIYYDMEAYPNNTSCRAAVKSFMSGWVGRLHELGNRAGGYGSACASYVSDWATITNVPDDIWPAAWYYNSGDPRGKYDPNASVWNVACINNGNWVNHQRIRQYTGGHQETWGGLTFNIDSDIADGHVAGNNSRGVFAPIGPAAPTEALSRTSPSGISNMQLISDQSGWIISSNRLMLTNDNGQQWQDITPTDKSVTLRTAYFLDGQTGWAVLGGTPDAENRSGLVLARTTDAGQTWQSTPIEKFNPVDGNSTQSGVSLQFIDARTGWLSIDLASSSNFKLGSLYQTSDGGVTWSERTLPVGGEVRFIDARTGWVAGGVQGNQLYVTHDGGQTWQAQTLIAPQTAKAASFYYDLPTFSTAREGLLPVTISTDRQPRVELYATRDGGETWALAETQPLTGQITPGHKLPTAILDNHRWLLVDQEQGALMAIDGRQATPRNPSMAGVIDLQFANAQVGWARTATGTCAGDKSSDATAPTTFRCDILPQFLITTDGGVTWQAVTP